MRKINTYLCLIGGLIILSGCSTMHSLHDKLANAQLQKKQLANGRTVYIDINVPPTADWNCNEVDTPQAYNWAMLQTEGQFHLTGSYGLLTDKALNYANQNDLKINYINLEIPTESTFTTGNNRITNSLFLNSNAQAYAKFYSCKKINPQHKLGSVKHEDFSILVN